MDEPLVLRAPPAAVASVMGLARGATHVGFLVTRAELAGTDPDGAMGRLIDVYADAVDQPRYRVVANGRMEPDGTRSRGKEGLKDLRQNFGTGNEFRTLYLEVGAIAAIYHKARRPTKGTDLIAATTLQVERGAARRASQEVRRTLRTRGIER